MAYLTQTAVLIGQIQIAASAVITQAEADHTAAAGSDAAIAAADQEGVTALTPVLASLNAAETALGLPVTPATPAQPETPAA